MNFFETKYNSDDYFGEFHLYVDLITKLNNGNIVIIIHNSKKRKIEGAAIRIYDSKLKKILEIYININSECTQFYELRNGNMVYKFKYKIFIIKNILQHKKFIVLQNIRINEIYQLESSNKSFELKNEKLLLFDREKIIIYNKIKNKYEFECEENNLKNIIDCVEIKNNILLILSRNLYFYNINTKQIISSFYLLNLKETKMEMNSYMCCILKLKKNKNMFVVSYGRYTLLFDSIKLKLISKLSKRKEVISTEYTGKNQIFELEDGSILLKDYFLKKITINNKGIENNYDFTSIYRFKIEDKMIKNYYSGRGELSNVVYIFPIKGEIIIAISDKIEFLGLGGKKSIVKTNKKYKNLKDLLNN